MSDEKVRITVTLRKDVYEKVKKLAYKKGLKPSTYITMMITSKVNEKDGNG
ncbi:MAG: hypothetical protein ACE5K0_12195 [Candidatus Methanofastidiosia archaeon]